MAETSSTGSLAAPLKTPQLAAALAAFLREFRPHPGPSPHGRRDAGTLPAGGSAVPLQPHPLADAAALRCQLTRASWLGEGQEEGRFALF